LLYAVGRDRDKVRAMIVTAAVPSPRGGSSAKPSAFLKDGNLMRPGSEAVGRGKAGGTSPNNGNARHDVCFVIGSDS
jgi:hypothetical protein